MKQNRKSHTITENAVAFVGNYDNKEINKDGFFRDKMRFNAFEMLPLFMPLRNQIMAVYKKFREVKKNKLMTLEKFCKIHIH